MVFCVIINPCQKYLWKGIQISKYLLNYWWKVIIGTANGLAPWGDRPLAVPMMTKAPDVFCRHPASKGSDQLHVKYKLDFCNREQEFLQLAFHCELHQGKMSAIDMPDKFQHDLRSIIIDLAALIPIGAWCQHIVSRIWVSISTADGLAQNPHHTISCAKADFSSLT